MKDWENKRKALVKSLPVIAILIAGILALNTICGYIPVRYLVLLAIFCIAAITDHFDGSIARKRKIRLFFKNQNVLEGIPIEIKEDRDRTFFHVFNKRLRIIDTSRLSGVEITDSKYNETFNGEQVTIFILRGALAKRYEPRENERLEMNNDGTVTITNKNENKELLFSRLLRYEDYCEIIKPKIYRDEFKQLIQNTLDNYGVS